MLTVRLLGTQDPLLLVCFVSLLYSQVAWKPTSSVEAGSPWAKSEHVGTYQVYQFKMVNVSLEPASELKMLKRPSPVLIRLNHMDFGGLKFNPLNSPLRHRAENQARDPNLGPGWDVLQCDTNHQQPLSQTLAPWTPATYHWSIVSYVKKHIYTVSTVLSICV